MATVNPKFTNCWPHLWEFHSHFWRRVIQNCECRTWATCCCRSWEVILRGAGVSADRLQPLSLSSASSLGTWWIAWVEAEIRHLGPSNHASRTSSICRLVCVCVCVGLISLWFPETITEPLAYAYSLSYFIEQLDILEGGENGNTKSNIQWHQKKKKAKAPEE